MLATPSTADTLDRARFPRVAAYLDKLPQGLASYPECQVRGSVLRHQLERKPLRDAGGGLPARLEQLASAPPPNTAWIPEVELIATNMAIADHYKMSDAAFLDYAYESNKALFNGIIYRLAMSLLSPQTVVESGAKRWGLMHRGSVFEAAAPRPGQIDVTLTFPPDLFNPLELQAFGKAFQAATDMSRNQAKLTLMSFDARKAVYRATW